jgi:hypothetical protein
MADSESAFRVRKHRLRQLGREGKPSPYADLDWSVATREDVALNTAWAEGVWERLGAAEERRRLRKLHELEAEQKREIPEQSTSARLARARAYANR